MEEKKENENTLKEWRVTELEPIYSVAKSFYKKAIVQEYEYANGDIRQELWSYNTLVAKVENGVLKVRGWFSQTTARHINEFLAQCGRARMSKREMLQAGMNW